MLRILTLLFLLPLSAMAADADYKLVIENHRFQPAELTIPAGKKIRLMVENHDATPEEFDSHSMNREKVIPGNSSGLVFIGPLDPGRYPFMGEFHAATAQGAIIAK
jgi:plastocyanin